MDNPMPLVDPAVIRQARVALAAKYFGQRGVTGTGLGLCTGPDGIARMGVVISTDGTRIQAPRSWDVTDSSGKLLGTVLVRVENTGTARACSQFWQKISSYFVRHWPFKSFGQA